MSIIPRYLALAVAASALVTLSACTPTAPVATSPTPIAPTSTGPSATATPVPVPTTASVAPPVARVPLQCGDLAPDAQLTAAMSATLSPEDFAPIGYIDGYVITQSGAIRCDWAAPGGPSSNPMYTISIMPDTTKYFNNYSTYLKSGATITSPFGPNSYLNCDSSPKALRCSFDLLYNGTWLNIEGFTDRVNSSLSNAQILARFKPLIQTAVTAFKGVTVVEPGWTNPAASPVVYPKFDSVSMSKVSAAVGFTVESANVSPDIISHGSSDAAFRPVNYRDSDGGGTSKTTGDYGVSAEVLPGGAWAWAQINAAAAGELGYTPVSGLGTQAISFTTPKSKNTPKATIIEGIAGGNLYAIQVTGSKNAKSNPLGVATKAAGVVLLELG